MNLLGVQPAKQVLVRLLPESGKAADRGLVALFAQRSSCCLALCLGAAAPFLVGWLAVIIVCRRGQTQQLKPSRWATLLQQLPSSNMHSCCEGVHLHIPFVIGGLG